MDNAPIHTPLKLRELVESRGYKCWYLPPYSLFLNPIEELWSKVKAGVRRTALTADDRLSDHICESVQMVTQPDCQAWIRHAVSFFPSCKQEDNNLEKRRWLISGTGLGPWGVGSWIPPSANMQIDVLS